MRRSPVKVGAMCAAILLSPIASVQQPKAAYLAQAEEQGCPQSPQDSKQDPKQKQDAKPSLPATWTLFLVAIPYNGPWTITAVAAFNNKDDTKRPEDTQHTGDTKDDTGDNAKDVACHQCFDALTALNTGNPSPKYRIPGLRGEVADAGHAEGTAQYLMCLPAAAPGQRGGASPGSNKEP